MRLVPAITLLTLGVVANAHLLSASNKQEIDKYDLKIRILQNELKSECPMVNFKKREYKTGEENFEDELKVKQKIYADYFKDLLRCQREKLKPQPAECQIARNFTESWRLDHSGSNFKPGGVNSYKGHSCDFHNATQWFRFTGAAGKRMLDTCPKWKSCGTAFPLWTDAESMPMFVGNTTIINTFQVFREDCRFWKVPVYVMRCSVNTYDLIYKVIYRAIGPNFKCNYGFCGMN